jgi:hypothetical protein
MKLTKVQSCYVDVIFIRRTSIYSTISLYNIVDCLSENGHDKIIFYVKKLYCAVYDLATILTITTTILQRFEILI